MPRGKRIQQEAPPHAPPAAPIVQTMNAAPLPSSAQAGYGAPAPNPTPVGYPSVAPGSAAAAYGAPTTGYGATYPNGNATMGPPPPREAMNPFVNAQLLWAYQRPIKAKIDGMRDATGSGKPEFEQKRTQFGKRSWFLDFTLEDGKKAVGRINEGDMRHHKLWAAYQGNNVGRTVVLRLSNPGDIDPFTQKPTKAPWMIDPQ